tara:strand:- start:261 stop:527 length:267 start_codon:yes stop_codon:yes gene_type:complete
VVENVFHESTVVNKTGNKYVIYWNQKCGFLYGSGDVEEYELKGLTNRGRKFTGTGVYLTDRTKDRTWLAKVIDVVPVHSRGWHPVDEK